MNETLGKWHFALTFLFSNGTFFPMHIIGVRGHPRRYADPTLYEWLQPIQGLNIFMTVCAMLLGLTQLIFFANFFISLFRGKRAERNPWHSNTLEWTAPSPPPHGNFETIPVVYRGPYEYSSLPEGDDYLPQTDSTQVGEKVPVHAH
jgi:cytochrome c oxidase subunit 1